LYFYKLKCNIVNVFVDFYINKIIVPRSIGQHPLGSGPYDLYANAYGPYGLRHVIYQIKSKFIIWIISQYINV
jgi:hypothetical protein